MADQMENTATPSFKLSATMPLFTLQEIENLMYGDLGKYSWFHFYKAWSAIESGEYIALIYLEKLKQFS